MLTDLLFFRKKGKGKGDKNRPVSNEGVLPPDEQQPAKEPLSESERLLMQRFKTFEVSLKEITDLVDRWDRTIGAPRPPVTPNHDADDHHGHPQSGRKGKKDKGDKHKQHEQAEKEAKEKEKEVCPFNSFL